MKRIIYLAIALLIPALLTVGCGKDIDESGNKIPDAGASVPDPDGTITLSLRNKNNGSTYIGNTNFCIDEADNFSGYGRDRFASIGTVKGLGNVAYIPKSGWANKIAVTPGQGVVAYDHNSGNFYRIYVIGYTVGTNGGIIGADIKYQTPFYGIGDIRLSKNSVEFPQEGGSEEIMFTASTISPVEVEADGCYAEIIYDDFLPAGIRITASPNQGADKSCSVTLRAKADGTTVEIPVKVKGSTPNLELPASMTIPCAAATHTVEPCQTNIDIGELEFSYSADWLHDALWVDYERFTFTADSNMEPQSRNATITVSAPKYNISAQITITQSAFELTISDGTSELQTLNFTRKNANRTFYINPSALEAESESQAPEWCTVMRDGNGNMLVRVTDNETGLDRETKIIVKAGSAVKEIPVYQSKYHYGDNYEENGLQGVVAIIEGHHGKILSNENTSTSYFTWSTETVFIGATDHDNGEYNMNVVKSIADWQTLYPAFAWCDSLGDGWYLPAINELQIAYENKVSNGGENIPLSGSHISSTEADATNGYYIWFGYYDPIQTTLKTASYGYYIRAMHVY